MIFYLLHEKQFILNYLITLSSQFYLWLAAGDLWDHYVSHGKGRASKKEKNLYLQFISDGFGIHGLTSDRNDLAKSRARFKILGSKA